jgi:phosphodiesterase/alkaline phosphatase D-like protein
MATFRCFYGVSTCLLLFWLSCLPVQGGETDNYISHGPILGRLSAHGIGIWARTASPGSFAVRYGLATDDLDNVTEPVITTLEHDCTGWIAVAGLQSDTRYYYELIIPDYQQYTGRKGSFRTLPDARDYVDAELNPAGLFNFSFEFACGNNQTAGQGLGPELPTFKTMLDHLQNKIHFAILNGDWLYEARREYKPSQWLAQVNQTAQELPEVIKAAPTLVGVWENYKHYLDQSSNLARWHRNIPSFFSYDDHEILNDIWGAGTPGLRDRRAVYRDIGVRAWYDYLGWSNPTPFSQPIVFGRTQLRSGSKLLKDDDADFSTLDLNQASNLHVHWGTETAGVNDNALDGVGGQNNAGVYRIVKIIDAQTLEIEPPAPADETNSYSIGRRSYYHFRVTNCDFFVLDTRGQREMHDTRDPHKKGLSILGKEQREWLLDGVSKSDADFIFVVSSVNLTVPAWTVFFDERERLIDFWDKLDKPVFVLTGDLHNSFVIQLTDNVWEFASGPHNSANHWVSDEGNRPATGSFKYGPREVDIHWSTYYRSDIPRQNLLHPTYCVVQINNVFNNPIELGERRWVAFPRPQVIFQYYDGLSGDLKYAHSVRAAEPAE